MFAKNYVDPDQRLGFAASDHTMHRWVTEKVVTVENNAKRNTRLQFQ